MFHRRDGISCPVFISYNDEKTNLPLRLELLQALQERNRQAATVVFRQPPRPVAMCRVRFDGHLLSRMARRQYGPISFRSRRPRRFMVRRLHGTHLPSAGKRTDARHGRAVVGTADDRRTAGSCYGALCGRLRRFSDACEVWWNRQSNDEKIRLWRQDRQAEETVYD